MDLMLILLSRKVSHEILPVQILCLKTSFNGGKRKAKARKKHV